MRTSSGRWTCLYGILILIALESHAAGSFRVRGPATIDNDASCDISLLPVATLLLPYFEVDIASAAGTGENTIFTITNVSQLPQIARVTLMTDLAYPVFAFTIYLPIIDEQTCVDLPVELPRSYRMRMQSAFTSGKVLAAGPGLPQCNRAVSMNDNAVGYATIDVVGNCAPRMADPTYFANDIRFDNVLIGDYQQVNGDEDFAEGGSMMHIRAIPEGGTPESRAGNRHFGVNSPRTFYSRYQHPSQPLFDARQPLPSRFAARWISGGAGGFETYFKIWREAAAGSCAAAPGNYERVREVVRFDEEENFEVIECDLVIACFDIYLETWLRSTSMLDAGSANEFPPNWQAEVGGWIYLNLDGLESGDEATQAWVVVSMRAEDRFSGDVDALALGNGCSAPLLRSEAHQDDATIGPAPNKRRD